MATKKNSCLKALTINLIGLISIIGGIYMYSNWIDIFTKLRGKEMALSPTSPSYEGWKISPLPLNFDVYLFNWTNPEQFGTNSTVKPHFDQLGPYRFREMPDKVNITWHAHNNSVSYEKLSTFYFDAENSNGTLNDIITSVNTVAHSAALRAKDGSGFAKGMLQRGFLLYNEELTVTKSADEWLFTGYTDPLVKWGRFLSMFSSDIIVPFDRIGWFYKRNGSYEFEGHFNVHTGLDNISKMGQINTWNNMSHNNVFPNECGEVKGSMGEFFPPNLTTNDTISIYLPNLCRSIPMDYVETVKIHGVTAYKFSAGRRAIDNGTRYPEAKCFCVNDKCEASGVINISPCKYNSSIYMSYPHFYQADPSYLEAIDGLAPDSKKHEFFMTLEPNAGVPMDVGGGFQANYLMEPVQGIRQYENVPRIFIPLMWAEERVRVTPEIGAAIALVPLFVLIGQIATGILFACGLILLCWYPAKYVSQLCHDPKKKSNLLLNINATSNSLSTNNISSPPSSRNSSTSRSINSASSLLGTGNESHAQHNLHNQNHHIIEGLPLLDYKSAKNGVMLSNRLKLTNDIVIIR